MTRIFEVLVSLLIVFVLAVVVAVFLPDHGHVERSVEVSSPLRQIYDSLNTFRRFPEWSALRRLDPQVRMNFAGPESGEGAKVLWTSSQPKVGDGSLEIASSEQDSTIKMAIDNDWSGINKVFTVTLTPSSNGKTVRIGWSYDVDYGWNLVWRYAGLYIHGEPDTHIQVSLNNIAAMLAQFPNVDYKDQDIALTDIVAKPIFLVATKAERNLDAVAEATDAAMAQIQAALKKTGLNAAGPRMTITTNWGDENYVFDVAVPVDAGTFTLDKQSFTITPPVEEPADTTSVDAGENDLNAAAPELQPGSHDEDGYLVVDGNVRAVTWYQGKALVTDYQGNPAALPLLRRMEKAYAETHGYPYSEMYEGRFWDELTSAPDVPEDQQTYKIYLPVQVVVTDENGSIPPDANTAPVGAVPSDGSTPPADGSAPPDDGSAPPTDDSTPDDTLPPADDGTPDDDGGV